MQGQIVSFVMDEGIIRGEDGREYLFRPADLIQSQSDLSTVRRVDFVPDGDRARDVLVLETGGFNSKIERRNGEGRRLRTRPATPLESFWGYGLTGLTRRYFDFQGRARRKEFLAVIALAWIIVLSPLVIYAVLAGNAEQLPQLLDGADDTLSKPLGTVFVLLLCLVFFPNLAVSVRRLHDTGRSGWVWCLTFLPYIGSVIVLILCLLPSQKGTNVFGPPPER